MTLCLLLLFSMLVTLSAGALYYVSRTASEAYLYQQGLSSVYAAESGANVALGRLKAGGDGKSELHALGEWTAGQGDGDGYVGIPHGGDGDLYGIGRRGRVQADGADHVHERRA